MVYRSVLASALVGLAAAANKAPNVPVSGQIGALDFGITCNVPLLGTQTFQAFFTATAPIQGSAGEEIYYDDLIAHVTIPGSLTSLAGLIGGSQANANVNVSLNLDNATPSPYKLFPNGYELDKVKFTPGQPVTARVPANGTLAPIGPVTLGEAGKTHRIRLGEVDIALTVLDDSGKAIFGPLPISCPAPAIPYDIGIVNVLPAGTGAFKGNLSNGGDQSAFANITNGQETGSFRFPYTCDFSNIGTTDIDLSISGTVPTYVNPGKQMSATDSYAFLRGDAAFVEFLQKTYPTAASVKTTVSNYTIGVSNGSPATLQALKSPVVTTSKLSAAAVGIPFPADSTLTIGPITAGMADQELYLTSGNATGSVRFLDASGKSLGTSSFSCKPKYPSELFGIPVSTLRAPVISS